MKDQKQEPLPELLRVVAGDHIIGLRTILSAESDHDSHLFLPKFEQSIWLYEVSGEKMAPIPPALLEELTHEESGNSVFINAFPPNYQLARRLTIKEADSAYYGSGAIIHHVLSSLPRGTTTAVFAPAELIIGRKHEDLRAEIDRYHGIQWVIYADGRLLSNVHNAAQFVILVLAINTGPSDVTRLANLRALDPSHWLRNIRAAKKRGGGEDGMVVVLRKARLGKSAWTYERWTKAFAESIKDSQELGSIKPLGDLVHSIVAGLNLSKNAELIQIVDEENDSYADFLPVITGREVRPDGIGLFGLYRADPDKTPDHMLALEGDLLLRSLLSPGRNVPRVVGAVVPPGLRAVPGQHVYRLRWKSEMSPQARDLLTKWLLSERVNDHLAAQGIVNLQIRPSDLLELEVPNPSESIIDALERLMSIERWYIERAESVRQARQEIFSAERYRDAVAMLLETEQIEGERIAAAEDSQKFDYQVRNYYPYPIALRRERLQVLEHGRMRLEESLDCAEHLVHFLALCALIQLSSLRPDESLPSRHLRSTLDGAVLRFSWGSSWSVLTEAVEATVKSKDPLLSAIPQLSTLADAVGQKKSEPGKAEAELRHQRNKQSHLHRVPDPELVAISRHLAGCLDELLQAVGFLADIPLAYVHDYALDSFTGERKATFELLRGSSVVFERSERVVLRELSRGDLGILDRNNQFHSLSPWLLFHHCQVCKRPEVFLFSRFEGKTAIYVAMETGHSWANDRVGRLFSRIITKSSS
jgi:hypothetical protein